MNMLQYLSGALFLAALPFVTDGQSVPPLVNYQGRLSNPDGSPLPTSDYEITFNVFDGATNGSVVWGPQIFDGTNGVPGHGPVIPVVQGYFNVMLGPVDTSSRSLASAFNGTNRFVEITISNHPPIAPRQQILAAPFAFQAANAAKLAGYDWSALLGTNDPVNGSLAGSRLAAGSVTSNQIANGTITAQQLAAGLPTNQSWFMGTPSSSIYYSGGNVGIGTNAPTRRLHVRGDALTPLILERNQAGGQSGLILYQPDTTDGNSLFISYRADTTGPGAANEVDLADIQGLANVHNNATRAGQIAFLTANGGPPQERMRLTETGNLGIAKPNPTTALDVNGTVTATAFSGFMSGTNLADGSITANKLVSRVAISNAPVGGLALSVNSGTFIVPTGVTNYLVTNVTATLQTTGRPVLVQLVPTADGEGNSYIWPSGSVIYVTLLRSSGGPFNIVGSVAVGGNCTQCYLPPSVVSFVDTSLPAGQYTYEIMAATGNSSAVYFVNLKLMGVEL